MKKQNNKITIEFDLNDAVESSLHKSLVGMNKYKRNYLIIRGIEKALKIDEKESKFVDIIDRMSLWMSKGTAQTIVSVEQKEVKEIKQAKQLVKEDFKIEFKPQVKKEENNTMNILKGIMNSKTENLSITQNESKGFEP